jgi:hypothetical protein
MKRNIIVLLLGTFLLLNGAFAIASIPAVTPQSIQQDLKAHFSRASDINWVKGAGFYKASFRQEGLYLQAYYATDGHFIGLARNLSFYQLPLVLQRNIRQVYAGYWISDVREFISQQGTDYYITFENATEQIILKNSGNNQWDILQKIPVILG